MFAHRSGRGALGDRRTLPILWTQKKMPRHMPRTNHQQLATRGSWGSESCLHIENTQRPSLASRSRSVIKAAPPDATNARARQVPSARLWDGTPRQTDGILPAVERAGAVHTLITADFFHRFRTHIRRLSFQSIVFGTIRGGIWEGARDVGDTFDGMRVCQTLSRSQALFGLSPCLPRCQNMF